jgi:peptidoglycan L-alanyl-D-glutamate endopeptidase CwlK
MPMFSDESRTKLSTCHMDLQVIFYEVIRCLDCTIIEGHRNELDQDFDFKQGITDFKWPNGKHNILPSNAVDVTINPIDWDNKHQLFWFAGYVLGIAEQLKQQGKITHSLRWVSDWDINCDIRDEKSLSDLVHFELVI